MESKLDLNKDNQIDEDDNKYAILLSANLDENNNIDDNYLKLLKKYLLVKNNFKIPVKNVWQKNSGRL